MSTITEAADAIPLCAICDHIEAVHVQFNFQHAFRPAADQRVSYRVKLEGKHAWYVDVLAMSHEDATRIALRTHTLACSAQCIGRTP